jgi:hypothetical protein
VRRPALPAIALGGLLAVPLLGGTHSREPVAETTTPTARVVLADAVPAPKLTPVRPHPKPAPGRPGELRVVPAANPRPAAGGISYVVEVEGGLPVDPANFAAVVRRTLRDPRGWSWGTALRFRRVDSADADLRIALASPALTNALCLPLLTKGIFSCAAGNRAVLNVVRWRQGAEAYAGEPLSRYRAYMVNHEVGHVLGHAHASCPAPGEPAPLMMQQTKGTDGCRPNPWPLSWERG